MEEITLSISDDILNMDDKVWSESTADGDKLVVIKSRSGFEKFKFKTRKL